MSRKLIDHSPGLKRLSDLGYSVSIKGGFLVIEDIPYVDANRTVQRGILVSDLETDGQKTIKPTRHVVNFVGSPPCKADGTPIASLGRSDARVHVADGIDAQHQFSAKPTDPNRYSDYFDKMTSYIA